MSQPFEFGKKRFHVFWQVDAAPQFRPDSSGAAGGEALQIGVLGNLNDEIDVFRSARFVQMEPIKLIRFTPLICFAAGRIPNQLLIDDRDDLDP